MRRLRSSIRASLFFNHEDDEDGDDQNLISVMGTSLQQTMMPASEDNVASSADGQGQDDMEQEANTMRRRARSVSDTIGEFFRPSRKKRKGDPSNEDVENPEA
jgi:hypothetical protein